MGLDAWVYCNCIKEGKALPHPFPELLVFDETGEPTLQSEGEISLELWLTHDKWYRNSCPHPFRHEKLGSYAWILVPFFKKLLGGMSPVHHHIQHVLHYVAHRH